MIDWIFLGIAGLCFVTTALPLVPKPWGIVRIFDFPRVQTIVIVSLVMVATLLVSGNQLQFPKLAIHILCITVLAVQLARVLRYSPLARQTLPRLDGQPVAARLKLIGANVKMGNRDYRRLVNLIETEKPDIAIFMEVDQPWFDALRPVLDAFPHRIEQAQDNTYGMVLASRLPLTDCRVMHLVDEEVPSFSAIVEAAPDQNFRLFCVHPEPPVPYCDTIGRDAELAKIGELAREETLPVLVCGDLNDVAWSRTTRRFVRVSGLLDPREGRGMYNSFHAQNFLFRWPLDHIFVSGDFALIAMHRLPDIGSDHFPMIFELALLDGRSDKTHADASKKQADEDDEQEVSELKHEARDLNRRPIGTDWEE